jgi:hypothetical protein
VRSFHEFRAAALFIASPLRSVFDASQRLTPRAFGTAIIDGFSFSQASAQTHGGAQKRLFVQRTVKRNWLDDHVDRVSM